MIDTLLEARLVRMPELATGAWLNTTQLLSKQSFQGQVALIDFWDYTCVNCLRTLPYLKSWHERYAKLGLTIVGIHSPEFEFAGSTAAVQAAITEQGIAYPVLMDNLYENWERFANKAWPTKYLVDSRGYLRFRRQGEGSYHETESAIQKLLIERDPNVILPDLLAPLRPEDRPGAVCYRATPELFAGYQMGGLHGHAIGNMGQYDQSRDALYQLPPAEYRLEGKFYLDGQWLAQPESISPDAGSVCRLTLPYRAASVNVVIGPAVDSNESVIYLGEPVSVNEIEILQDGRSLTGDNAGKDVVIHPNGRSTVTVAYARMVELVRNESFEPHELSLIFASQSIHLYSFSFTSCVVGDDRLASEATN